LREGVGRGGGWVAKLVRDVGGGERKNEGGVVGTRGGGSN